MYDVANRESFDALPRWYSELETYVSPKVVKMVVGNKVDKVRALFSPRFFVVCALTILIVGVLSSSHLLGRAAFRHPHELAIL